MKWFYDLNIAHRLMVLNLVAALALFAVTGFGIYQSRRDRVLALSRDNKKEEADALLNGAMADAIGRVETTIEAHRAYIGQLGKQGAERARALIANANAWEVAGSLVVLGCVLGLAIPAARSITRPLARAAASWRTSSKR